MPRPIPVPIVLHVDPEPFVDSLRRIYQDEFCHSVLRATLMYQNQITDLDMVWSTEDTADDDSTFLVDKEFPEGVSLSMCTSIVC